MSALAIASIYPSVLYAADNINLSYNVTPNQILTINLEEKVGKISNESSFAVTGSPKDGSLTRINATQGIFDYLNKLDNTTENVVITETSKNQARMFNIKFDVGLTPLVANQNLRIGLGILSAIIIGIIVTLSAIHILHKSKSRFFDIIRTPDMDPSLSLFQFLVWTWVVIFSFVLVYTIKILAGDYNLAGSVIPGNLLVLMGISTAVPIISTTITRAYYERDLTEENSIANYFESKKPEDLKKLEDRRKENPVSKMLMENNKPTLGRYQMFAWTFIGIFIYLFSLSALVSSSDQPQEIRKMSVPDVDITIVVLMGLSSTAFLGLKAVNSYMQIREVLPETVKTGGQLQIFGRNFGVEADTVWIGDKAIKSSDQPTTLVWTDDRIDLKVLGIERGNYYVRVVKKGSSVKYSKQITIE
ncbi:MAG TPA: hypothetical protein VFC05_00760 [Nitrososphaeraceae archaeon]|jgi:hypothetical protein|nr:hypothetical protein [Nitrososphaeraceae archaeon]